MGDQLKWLIHQVMKWSGVGWEFQFQRSRPPIQMFPIHNPRPLQPIETPLVEIRARALIKIFRTCVTVSLWKCVPPSPPLLSRWAHAVCVCVCVFVCLCLCGVCECVCLRCLSPTCVCEVCVCVSCFFCRTSELTGGLMTPIRGACWGPLID